MYYGLVNPRHVRDYARAVCDVLGGGANNMAIELLVETAAQETHCGRCRDPHFVLHGVGLYQIDPIGHEDVVTRVRMGDVTKVINEFGFDPLTVKHHDLAFNPLFSTVFARLFYKLRRQPIPDTREGRAAYWKQHYNTIAGRGTVEQYLQNIERYGV